jgi:putative ABC transport system permease protein
VGGAFIAAGLFGHSHNAIKEVALGGVGVFVGVAMLAPLFAEPVARLLGAPLAWARGVPGRLGRGNAMRNPKRTAATASSLMIGVALVGFLTVFAASAKRSYNASVNTSIKGDFVISGGTMGGGFPPQLTQEIAHVPGVRVAAGYRTTTVALDNASKTAAGIDPVAYPQVVDLQVTKGSLAALGDNGVALLDSLASSHHWRLGDSIPVRFAEAGTRHLTLVALYSQKVQAAPVVVSMAIYEANVESQLDTTIYVASDGHTSSTVRAGLDAVTAAYPTAKVQNHAEYVKTQLGPVGKLLALVYVLLAFAVVVALLGISNTLALSLHERTRELGLLRAVGMARRQLRVAVRAEAAIVAAFGTLLGLVIGVGFGYLLVKAAHNSGIGHFTVPMVQLGVIAAIAGLAGIGAAALPARRAANLDVLDAIAAR